MDAALPVRIRYYALAGIAAAILLNVLLRGVVRFGGLPASLLIAAVIAGGLAEAGDILLAPTRKAFAENLTAGTHRPAIPVVLAEGGQEAGLVGAADLARQP